MQIVIAVSTLVTHELAEGARVKRSIGEWFSGFFKKFKKKPARRPQYAQLSYSIPQPSYQQAPPSYHPPPQYHFSAAPVNPHLHHQPHHGAGAAASVGYGHHHASEATQSHHHAGGDVAPTYGSGGLDSLHGGFGPLKHDDIISHGHSGSGNSYSAPNQGLSDSYVAPAISVPSTIETYHPPSPSLSAPAPASSYIAPVQPALTAEYKSPVPPVPLPMAPHGTSDTSHIGKPDISAPTSVFSISPPEDGAYVPPAPNAGYQPHIPTDKQPLALSNPAPAPVPAPSSSYIPSPDPVHSQTILSPSQSYSPAPAPSPGYFPAEAPAPAPVAVQPPAPATAYASPSEDAGTYAVSLDENDPIIEIVFEDADPLPPQPLPTIDPALYAPQDEEVEVYFIEYSPDAPIDNIEDLDLGGAQRAILEDLPEELPADIRSQLLGSGVLDDAMIQIIDIQDGNLGRSLDSNELAALNAAIGAESNQVEVYQKPDKQAVDLRVHRVYERSNTTKGKAEIINGVGAFKEGTFIGTVKVNDESAKSYLPIKVDNKIYPLPNHPDINDKPIRGVLLVAQSEENTNEGDIPNFTTEEKYNQVPDASTTIEGRRAISRSFVDSQDTGDWIPIIRS